MGGLVASTLDIADTDFLAGKYTFANGGSAGSVVNLGTINAAQGGYVALLAPDVSNQGVITAKLGTVALAGGNQVTLDTAGDGLIKVTVDQGAVNALAENKGLIQAQGGLVYLGAKNAGDLAATVVNNTGIIEANSLVEHDGKIMLIGGSNGGVVANTGTLDTTGTSTGGSIELSGSSFDVQGFGTSIKTGNILIDPADIIINHQTTDTGLLGTTISDLAIENVLNGNTNVTIQASSSITVLNLATGGGSGVLQWGTANSLTLQLASAVSNGNISFGQNTNEVKSTGGGSIVIDASASSGGALQNLAKLTTNGGNVTLLADSGGIDIHNSINIGTGTLTATASNGGNITQNLGTITAGTLNISATGTNATVTTVGGTNINTTGSDTITSGSGGVSLGGILTSTATGSAVSVNGGSGGITLVTGGGLTANSGSTTLDTTGTLSIGAAVNGNGQTINLNNMANMAITAAVSAGAAGTINISGGNAAGIGIGGPATTASYTNNIDASSVGQMTANTLNIGSTSHTGVIGIGTFSIPSTITNINIINSARQHHSGWRNRLNRWCQQLQSQHHHRQRRRHRRFAEPALCYAVHR